MYIQLWIENFKCKFLSGIYSLFCPKATWLLIQKFIFINISVESFKDCHVSHKIPSYFWKVDTFGFERNGALNELNLLN